MRRKKTWLWALFGFVLLLVAYAFTRLTNLASLPIFTDEAIYIRWSQIGMRDAAWRFISLSDGKQPMFTWAMMALLRVFRGWDPLLVGRLTSVIAGCATLIGLWFLSHELFRNKRIAWLTSTLYVMLPFTTWYDRMALYDSMVSTFSVWSLYLGILLAKRLRLDTALLLGMVLAGGMLNKSSGFLSLYFLPVTLLVFDWQKKHRILRFLGLALVAAVLSQLLYSVLRLSPFFYMISQKDNVFVFSLSEWFNQPFRFFAGNLRGMFDWLRQYMTTPLFIAAFVSWFTRWPRLRERILLVLWWALPFAALANFAKVLYPRFVLFMAMPLVVLSSYTVVHVWEHVRKPFLRFILALALFVPSLYVTSVIVLRPVAAPIPFADRGQFIYDWPAGGGIKEAVTYLRAEATRQKISVFTDGTFGLLPYAVEIYLVDHPNVKITGLWPLPEHVPAAMIQDASVSATYFVMNQTQVAPAAWPLTLIGEYAKGSRVDSKKLRLYRVNLPFSALP